MKTKLTEKKGKNKKDIKEVSDEEVKDLENDEDYDDEYDEEDNNFIADDEEVLKE
jgi:hypothetical protein